MKKIVLVLIVLALFGGFISAQEVEGPMRVDSSGGIYYDAFPLQSTNGFQFLEAIFNLRVGGHLGLGVNLNDSMTIGGEVGILAMYWESGYYYYTLLDLPFRGYFDIHAGDAVALRAFGGGLAVVAIGNGIATAVLPEVGARVSLGGLYLEATYVFANTPYQRYGIGYTESF